MAVQRTLIGNIKGPKGDKGDTGDTGSRGAGATVTIGSVTTTAYGGNANVTNSGTVTDAVLDFVLPQGAPGETVTDMENLTLSSMTEPSVQFPIPSIGDTGKVIFGKITKWFSDMTNLVATKLNIANVVNNLTTTTSGYALDARQGKALNDSVNSLSSNFNTFKNDFMSVESGSVSITAITKNVTSSQNTAICSFVPAKTGAYMFQPNFRTSAGSGISIVYLLDSTTPQYPLGAYNKSIMQYGGATNCGSGGFKVQVLTAGTTYYVYARSYGGNVTVEENTWLDLYYLHS